MSFNHHKEDYSTYENRRSLLLRGDVLQLIITLHSIVLVVMVVMVEVIVASLWQ